MFYYYENLGDYSIAWILCYKGGKLAAQYNARFVESVVFDEEESASEEDVPF